MKFLRNGRKLRDLGRMQTVTVRPNYSELFHGDNEMWRADAPGALPDLLVEDETLPWEQRALLALDDATVLRRQEQAAAALRARLTPVLE